MTMKNKRDIYCEYPFWEAFFEMEKDVLHDRQKRRLWGEFCDFLFKNNLFFDIPNQSVDYETPGGKNLNELRHKKGGAGIRFIPKKYPKINNLTDNDDNILNSVFLTMEETAKCKKLSERFGVLVFNLPMIFSAGHVYSDNGIAFDRNNGKNWKYLWELKDKCPSICHCNSLIVADRYLLGDRTNILNDNLKPIFEAFLPQHLDNNIVFTIYVITLTDLEHCSSIKEKLSEIKKLIEKLRPKLKFRLNIFHSNKLHDRSIITNNAFLTSGGGFDVITTQERAFRFTTTSLCFPFFQATDNVNDVFIGWITNIKNATKGCTNYQQNFWGDKNTKHHLLDFYYTPPVRKQLNKCDISENCLLHVRAR